MNAKVVLIGVVAISMVGYGRTIKEVEKEISTLRREFTKLQQNPVFVWGTRQENKSEQQKAATSSYNIIAAQGKERSKYKSKRVITLNPEYVCPIHKKVYKNDNCPSDGKCKAKDKSGVANFNNLGNEYDMSYRSWKLLKEKIPETEAQEAKLKELEAKIAELRVEQAEIKKQQKWDNVKKSGSTPAAEEAAPEVENKPALTVENE